MPQNSDTDVLIMGGGLAGLTLALQLRRRRAAVRISVLERNRFPVPVASHKIGESTVEIGANYFSEVLGLKEHLDEQHLRKFGFRFFFSEGQRNLDEVTEIGVSRPMATPSYQIDRGVFENFLAERARAEGITLIEAASVRQIDLAADGEAAPHQVSWRREGHDQTTSARWVVDAAGRAGLLKRKLGLSAPNEHQANAVWSYVETLQIDRQARTLRTAGAMAVHQSSGRLWLLGLADSAVVRSSFRRYRGRPAHSSAGADEQLRQSHGLVASVPAPAV